MRPAAPDRRPHTAPDLLPAACPRSPDRDWPRGSAAGAVDEFRGQGAGGRACLGVLAGSLSRGRALLRQIHRLALADIDADAELDIVRPGTALAEFYRLSLAATSQPLISAGLLTAAEAARLAARLDEPDFMGCGFTFIGVWGRRTDDSSV